MAWQCHSSSGQLFIIREVNECPYNDKYGHLLISIRMISKHSFQSLFFFLHLPLSRYLFQSPPPSPKSAYHARHQAHLHLSAGRCPPLLPRSSQTPRIPGRQRPRRAFHHKYTVVESTHYRNHDLSRDGSSDRCNQCCCCGAGDSRCGECCW